MGCGCKKKIIPPVVQPKTTVVKTTDNNIKINEATNTQPMVEANDIDNNTLINKITNRLKEITN
jgi:hypothetical protein